MFCSNCGKQLESDFKFCNSCGRPVEVSRPVEVIAPKKKHPLMTALAVVVGLLFIGAIINAISRNTSSSVPEDPAKKERDEKQFEKAVGGAVLLKRAMRNPDSFKLSSATVIEATDAACYEYRSQNGFGGMNIGQAVLTKDYQFKTDEMSGFAALWNKACAHKSGKDLTSEVNYALAHTPN